VHLKEKQRQLKIVFLVAIVVLLTFISSGCVGGIQAIGWSGGAISKGTLFVGSQEGRLVSISLADESRRWSEPLTKPTQSSFLGCSSGSSSGCGSAPVGVPIYGTPAMSDDGTRVFIAAYNGKVYAFAADSLDKKWVYPNKDFDGIDYLASIVGGLVFAQGNIYFGCDDGKVYALDAVTGRPKWKTPFTTGDKIWSTPAFNDGKLFVGSFDKKLYALNANDGTKVWEFKADGSIFATPLVQNGVIYVGSLDRYLYALNAKDGTLKWKFMGEKPFWAKPIASGDKIFAGCLDNNVYVLQGETGVLLTAVNIGSQASSSPVMVGNYIVFASENGAVYAIDGATNGKRLLIDLKQAIYGPLCASGDIVYIHTQDLTLHQVNAVSGAALRSISLAQGK
jgi:eukaryotic-like serine/threonine-protein kinase